jgi:chromatin assembly factor 1 subunit B
MVPCQLARADHFFISRSPDGQTLMMSSTDGYCSVVVFDYGELGVPYTYSEQPALKLLPSLVQSTAHKTGPPASPRSKAMSVSSSAMSHGDRDQDAPSAALGLHLGESSHLPKTSATSASADAVEERDSGEPKQKKRRIAPTLVTS